MGFFPGFGSGSSTVGGSENYKLHIKNLCSSRNKIDNCLADLNTEEERKEIESKLYFLSKEIFLADFPVLLIPSFFSQFNVRRPSLFPFLIRLFNLPEKSRASFNQRTPCMRILTKLGVVPARGIFSCAGSFFFVLFCSFFYAITAHCHLKENSYILHKKIFLSIGRYFLYWNLDGIFFSELDCSKCRRSK